MMLQLSLPALFLALGYLDQSSVDAVEAFQPYRITFDRLLDGSDGTSLMQALTTEGLISVTGIPESFSKNQQETLSALHGCVLEAGAAHETTFPDGTQRRTLATHTLPGTNGLKTIKYDSPDVNSACSSFDDAAMPFRKSVKAVTQAFAERLADVLDGDIEKPLLMTETGEPFNTMATMVEGGEHLEHFHSYQGAKAPQGSDDTIEWHTDQGLFIVFTPARWVDGTVVDEGFSVELEGGAHAQVQFDESDELVILLGDGVNQFINPKLKSHAAPLRAAPHALAMPLQDDRQQARVWYGRMVLPPATAFDPHHDDITIGDKRDRLVQESSGPSPDEEILSIGCSSSLQARALQEDCEDGTVYCWHRCMVAADYGVGEEICAEQGLDLFCTNTRGHKYLGGHGDYFPGCIDLETAPNYTDWDPIEPARDEEVCDHEAFGIHYQASSAGFDNELILLNDTAVFQWSVVDGDRLHGKILFNGLFGWIGFGFRNPGGHHNGMNGAKVILALPGNDYDPALGLNTSLDNNAQEYTIDPYGSSFRHWSTPVVTDDSEELIHVIHETECFTSLEFNIRGIQDQSFNWTGTDEFIWAANSEDTAVSYHTARGILVANWADETIVIWKEPEEEVVEDDDDSGSTHHFMWSGLLLNLYLLWQLVA